MKTPQVFTCLGFVLALSLCMLSDTSRAQQQHGEFRNVNITGVVYSDPGNQRISGALIQLCDSGGRVIAEHRTDGLGVFAFSGFASGSYTFRLTAEGYQATEFQPGDRIISDQAFTIYMKAIQPDSSQPPTNSSISAHELSMPRGARELYASGMKKLYGDKNARGGLEDFQKCLRKAPSFYEAQFQMGMAQLKLDKGQEAEVSFRKSIEMSGDKYAEANLALGFIYFDKGDLDAAKAQFHRALELNPSAWIACYKLGDIAYREKNLADAESWAGKAKLIAPKIGMIYKLLVQIHVEQRNYASALQDLDAYIQLEQDTAKIAQARELREKIQQRIENQ